MTTLERVCAEWGISPNGDRLPIEVPNVGRERELPALFHQLGFKVGAEIGVEQGEYSEALCRGIPGLRLICVDAWAAYPGYRDHVSQEKLEAFLIRTKDRLREFDVEIMRAWSVDAARRHANRSLDFVYIDANHSFPQVVNDLSAWTPKVRRGGIVAGHDFKRRKNPIQHHVVEAVTAWTSCYRIKPWFVLGRRERVPGETRDDSRSFMWVVP